MDGWIDDEGNNHINIIGLGEFVDLGPSKVFFMIFVRDDLDPTDCNFKWSEFNQIKEKGEFFLKKLHKLGFKRGCYDLQGIIDEKTGIPYMLECNPRYPILFNLMNENCGKGLCLNKLQLDILDENKSEINFLKNKDFIYSVIGVFIFLNK